VPLQDVFSTGPDGQVEAPQGLKRLFWTLAVDVSRTSPSVFVRFNRLPAVFNSSELM
jgi:hypothetical protein